MWRKLIGTVALAVVAGVSLFAQVIPPGALSADKPVFMDGKQVATTGPQGDLALALDPTKPYVVLRDSCSRYEIVLRNSKKHDDCEKENQRNENGCRRCEVAGFIIDGKWQTRTASSTTSSSTSKDNGGVTVDLFGFGGGKLTTISNAAETAIPTIQGRADAANYNQPRTVVVDERGAGGGFGGGLDVGWGARVGARIGVAFETERNSPSQIVDITRTAGGLIFQQNGDSNTRSLAALLGLRFHVRRGLTVTGGPAITWWNVDLNQTGSLRAGCPNACQTVRSDNVTSEVDGTDVGLHLGAEYYPGNSWAGLQVLWVRTTFQGVYDPTAALAWPSDWKDNNLFFGFAVRTRNSRR